mgnify:CR=1 FL=1
MKVLLFNAQMEKSFRAVSVPLGLLSIATYLNANGHDVSVYDMSHQKKKIKEIITSDMPDIVGVCEIENDTVIKDLLYNSPLQKQKYQYIHYESPDRRGIDVALLYRSDKFKVVFSQAIPFVFPKDSNFKTRDILYVKGIVPHCQDLLHLFVNHWPSRYGGYAQTIDFRNYAAIILRNYIDSILTISP